MKPKSKRHKQFMDAVMSGQRIVMQRPRRWQNTFDAFMGCMAMAERGKTFIYLHPDFVAIDKRTWENIQAKLNPPKIVYDEFSQISEKDLKEFEKQFKSFNENS